MPWMASPFARLRAYLGRLQLLDDRLPLGCYGACSLLCASGAGVPARGFVSGQPIRYGTVVRRAG